MRVPSLTWKKNTVTQFLDETDQQPREPRRGRRKVLTVFLVLIALLLVAAIAVGAYLFNLANNFNSGTQRIDQALPAADDPERPEDTDAENILLMGSDSREGEADEASVGGQRADTLMLLHVPADGGAAYVISIMRDTWVDIPGHGPAKINAALDLGGVELEVRTIEDLLDTRIDHVAQIDFEGFRELTDSMGGVTVDVPQDFTAGGHVFTQGEQKLDGEEALSFVRERYSFSDGDYQRVRNQRAYLRGLLNQVASPSTFSNPAKVNDMVKSFSPYVSVDDSLTAREIASIGMQVGPSGMRNVQMFTLPNAGTGWSDDGQSIVELDDAAVSGLADAMAEGTMDEYARTVPTD